MKTWFLFLSFGVGGTLLGLPAWTTALKGGQPFSVEDLISLAVAILTLGATVFIAIFIYALQKKDTKKTAKNQEIGAKKILYTELSTGLKTVIHAPSSGGVGDISAQLTTLLIAYLPYLQDSFSPEQLHHLLQLVDVMTSTAKQAVSEDGPAAAEYIQGRLGLFVEERFVPAMRSQYADQFSRLDDYRGVLTPLTRSVLEILSGESLPPAAADRLTALDGSLLLEAAQNGYTKIYNAAGELLCNALLDTDALGDQEIKAGWAKTRFYVGEFQDGKRHGQGCSYSLRGQHKVFEGKWEKDEFKTGTKFHFVLEKDPHDGEYKELFPYWDEGYAMSRQVTKYLTQRDDLTPEQILARLYIAEEIWVDGESFFVNTDFLYPLAGFMEKNDPDGFLRAQRINNLFCNDVEEDQFD